MSEGQKEQPEIKVYETNRFSKAIAKHSDENQKIIEDEIDLIIANPLLGERKKGNLEHLRVHKFKMLSQVWLLGYNWDEGKLTIHLLQFGSHENYYNLAKKNRKRDLKLVSD